VSSSNDDRGWNVSPPAGGQIRSYTFGPFAAEVMLRERKTMKVVKDMDGKGLEVRSGRAKREEGEQRETVVKKEAKEQVKGGQEPMSTVDGKQGALG